MAKLLIIDDETAIRHAFRRAFHAPEHQVEEAATLAEGLTSLSHWKPDVIILDVHLSDADGLAGFEKLKMLDARLPIIIVTGHGTTDLAIEAMKLGAFDYLLKPLEYDRLQDVISRASASSRLMMVPTVFESDLVSAVGGDALIGRCPAMQEVYKAIGRVASSDTTVLVLGESGTGKELVARAIYQHSLRKDKPFIAINCGAIPDTLIESELFGHEKGSFTGADRRRIGKFEQCSGGTLFLDEIGEMPLSAQVKLLRVLQEQRFERVGGTDTVEVNVRVIAATNADLEQRMAAGQFRSDLYYRLNVFTIRLPSLRERGGDLELLTDYCIARSAHEMKRNLPVIPDETRHFLRQYDWPGNIRELQSILKQAYLQMSGNVLLPEYLPSLKGGSTSFVDSTGTNLSHDKSPALNWDRFITERLGTGSRELYSECLTVMERQLIVKVLQRTSGNQLRAAELLGITRGTLRQKMRQLGVTLEKTGVVVEDEDD